MKSPHILGPVVLSIVLSAASSGRAQEAASAQEGEFSVQRFEPVPGEANYLSIAGARMSGSFTGSASLWFDYQREPFTVESCRSATDCSEPTATNRQDISVVENMYTWNAMGSFIPVDWAQVGLRVPVMLATGQGIDTQTGDPAVDGLNAVGLGDLYLEGKFRVFGDPTTDVVALGAAADLSFPTGHATAEGGYIGNSSPVTGGVRLIADLRYEDFSAAINARGVFKEQATLGNTDVGIEMRYGAAAAYRVHPLFTVLAEGFGSTGFSTKTGTNAFEVDGGVRITPLDGMLGFTLAGGAGILQGVGVPVARGIVGVGFYYDETADADRDGIPDDADACPDEAEDMDGIADGDGCPELDFDHDNIPDEVDRCPEKPETENGYEDDDGCPDSPGDADGDGIFDEDDKCPELAGDMKREDALGCPDADGDGVPDDGRDKCTEGPNAKEDADGFEDLDGCADPDNDGDGVPDVRDECAEAPETDNDYQDEDGCPDIADDDDGDGFSNDDDRCPFTPEKWNDIEDDDGCSEAGERLVTIAKDSIEIEADVAFEGATLAEGKGKTTLNALANGLKQWVSMVRVEIQVTAADAKVAQSRAEAVKAYLISKGVAERRLGARGSAGEQDVAVAIVQGPRD